MLNAKKSGEKSKPALENVGSSPNRTAGSRKDEVGCSGVHPLTRLDAGKDAEVRTAVSFGQGERGARGYKGGPELIYDGGQVLGGLEKHGSLGAYWVGEIVETPPEAWIGFFDSVSRQYEGRLASIEITQGNQKRIALQDRLLEGISCDHLGTRDEIYLSFEATHLLEARGALETVAKLARDWFDTHLASPGQKSEAV